MNDELWRVQLGTGEVRMMTLDGLDRAFDEGLVDARVLVLAPGSTAWTTLGQAAGLDDAAAEAGCAVETPSLSPVAISANASSFRPPVPAFDLDLPDSSALVLRRPSRRGAIVAAVVAGAVALSAVIGLGVKFGGAIAHDPMAARGAAVQAPLAAAPLLAPEAEPAKDNRPALSEDQKKQLLDADKAREDKARTKNQEKAEKADRTQRRKQPKSGPVFVNGGDKYDPLNGKL